MISHTFALANTAGALYSCQKGEDEREKTGMFLWQYALIRHRGVFERSSRGMPGGMPVKMGSIIVCLKVSDDTSTKKNSNTSNNKIVLFKGKYIVFYVLSAVTF